VKIPPIPGPVGVFDSGMGGLTVLKELAALRPQQDLLYLGDTARVPYGVRSPETIKRYAGEAAAFLVKQGISALVVACNTVTAVALEDLKSLPIPVFGVVEPGAKRAAETAPKGTIAVLATEATIKSGAYDRAIHRLAPEAKVVGRACPLFVPLAEEGWSTNDVARGTASLYLGDLRDRVDVAVLGCTHYPLLAKTISRVLGDRVTIVDSAFSTAVEVAGALPPAPGGGRVRFFVTDAPDRFKRIGAAFLGKPVDDVSHVDL
jgi:glutamate racemase